MSKQITGILKAPSGAILGGQSIGLVAIRSTPPGIIKGSTVSFSTDGAGLYDVTVENGYFRVTAESESGGDIALGSIYIDGGAPSDLPTLLSINEEPGAPVNAALQALADAAAASALAAEQSAIAAQAAADSINPADYVLATEKGAANGVAELDGSGIVPDAQLPSYIASSEKGTANGVATLEGGGKVPASQLPSYVDDVLEYPDFASLPSVGEPGKIYITLDDNKSWRWASTVYVEISSSMSGAEIKALYEAEPNTNAFTDAEESKLAGIESGATADQTGAEIKAAYEAEPNTNAFTDAEESKLAGIESGATADQTGAEIKAAYEAESDTNAFTDADKASVESFPALAVNTVAAAMGFTAHGLMREPNLDSDYTCPATTPNQFTVNVRQDRIGGTIVDIPSTNVTLPAAPSTSALLSRRDVVYLRENGAIEVFEGLDDNSDMATAGFSAVSGEAGLWSDGTGLAAPLAYVNRRNQGVYHPYFNENGCGEFSDNLPWYSTTDTVLSVSDCFASPSGGAIGGVSGRPDDLFYDAIYLSDITIPSLQATAPSPTQLEPDYWRDKLAANTFKGFRNEGIPFLVPIERGVVEVLSSSTSVNAGITADDTLYDIGDFIICLNQDNFVVVAGYVRQIATGNVAANCSTFTRAIADDRDVTATRTTGDIYTILKVEYREAKTSDLTWTDIIGDPANYPRQATGVIDYASSEAIPSPSGTAGNTVYVDELTTGSGNIGNVYLRIGSSFSSDLRENAYTNTSNWQDLGTKAEFLANARGMAGFPLIYGENGEDLIPGGTIKSTKASRKVEDGLSYLRTTDRGVSWASIPIADNWEGASNAKVVSESAESVIFLEYTTSALPLEGDVLEAVLGSKLGSVWAGNHFNPIIGSLLTSSLIGKVPTTYGGERSWRGSVSTFPIDSDGELSASSNFSALTHATISLSEAAVSASAKAVPYLTQDKQPKLQMLFKEMIYDTTWGDNNKFTVASNTATDIDDNGNTTLVGTKSASLPIVLSEK